MCRMHRILLLATFVATAPVLAGCADFDTDKLDIFGLGEKKKLPGERKALFPEGVPGVTQGIPPQYIKSNQPPPDTAQAAPVAPVEAAPAATPQKKTATVTPDDKQKPKPKQAVKPKPKPASTATAPAQPASQQAPAPWPEPARQQPAQPATAPWPGQEQSATSAPSTAPWPSAPPPGTFSR